MTKKGFDNLIAVQKEFLDAFGKANRAWVTCCNEEATLTSRFATKLSSAESFPQAAATCHEWAGQQMELLSKHAKTVMEETQGFTKACAQIRDVGKGAAAP
jgi:hypothetical protein